MRNPSRILIVEQLVILLLFLMAGISVQAEQSNPIVGTWKSVGYVDSTGQKIDYPENELNYTTILENGTFFRIGFRPDFPQGAAPTTLVDFQKIAANSWGQIGTYTVDLEKNTVSGKYLYSTNPVEIGGQFTIEFKVEGDTITHWMNIDGKKMWIFYYVRVK